jgi:hypothetical protein
MRCNAGIFAAVSLHRHSLAASTLKRVAVYGIAYIMQQMQHSHG